MAVSRETENLCNEKMGEEGYNVMDGFRVMNGLHNREAKGKNQTTWQHHGFSVAIGVQVNETSDIQTQGKAIHMNRFSNNEHTLLTEQTLKQQLQIE